MLTMLRNGSTKTLVDYVIGRGLLAIPNFSELLQIH